MVSSRPRSHLLPPHNKARQALRLDSATDKHYSILADLGRCKWKSPSLMRAWRLCHSFKRSLGPQTRCFSNSARKVR